MNKTRPGADSLLEVGHALENFVDTAGNHWSPSGGGGYGGVGGGFGGGVVVAVAEAVEAVEEAAENLLSAS